MIVFGEVLRPHLEHMLDGEVAENTIFIARETDAGYSAIFGFSNWSGEDVEGMLWAEKGGLTRELLRACARYVFEQLSCARLTIRVRSDNAAMLKIAPRLGFKLEGTMRKAHQGHDVQLFGMLKEDCPYL